MCAILITISKIVLFSEFEGLEIVKFPFFAPFQALSPNLYSLEVCFPLHLEGGLLLTPPLETAKHQWCMLWGFGGNCSPNSNPSGNIQIATLQSTLPC